MFDADDDGGVFWTTRGGHGRLALVLFLTRYLTPLWRSPEGWLR